MAATTGTPSPPDDFEEVFEMLGYWRRDVDGKFREPGQRKKGVPTDMHEIGLDWFWPATVRATVTRPEWPFNVTITITNSVDGATVDGLTVDGVDGHSVASVDLREIAVDQVVEFVQLAWLAWLSEVERNFVMWSDPADLTAEQRLERAAVAYRLAVLIRRNATEYVGTNLRVSRATAGRLVRQCRDVGLLGPALRSRAGERKGD